MTLIAKWLAVALAVSVAGNAVLGWAYLGQRDKATTEATKREAVSSDAERTEAVAQQCSDGVANLGQVAEARAEAASESRKQAKAKADVHYKRADTVLMTPAPVPQDACLSAQARASEWLKERKQ
ncbi:hypothetical protein [Comamonas serinivorans]|nr:hypothetical protein [Comamonas serinivorans]